MSYLRARLGEWSTALGVIVLAVSIAAAWWSRTIWLPWCAAIAGTVAMALPERLIKAGVERVSEIAIATVADDLSKPRGPDSAVLPSKDNTMTILQDIENAALAAVKTVAAEAPAPYGSAIAAVLSAAENPSPANVLAAIGDVVVAVEAIIASEQAKAAQAVAAAATPVAQVA